ncbi:MAG: hypothetical protein G01um101425_785 [Candidatus Peregrinibacteria bacterium Gr01-1014_25]|nr:MAG: hypothetical protein G01um101425_785 [Candidatus Peregrinibacteria bacterium Gr01-1014_25]
MPIRDRYIQQRFDDTGNPEDPYTTSLQNLPKDVNGIEGGIERLWMYPFKALGGLRKGSVRLTQQGFADIKGMYRDRMVMLAHGDLDSGESLKRFSQREEPKLALIEASMSPSETLHYHIPGRDAFPMPLEQSMPNEKRRRTNVVVAGDMIETEVEGDGPITRAIRDYLGSFRDDADRIHVLFPAAGSPRVVEDRHRCGIDGAETLLSDGGQILLESWPSWDFIQKSRQNSVRPIPINVTRPNIAVIGWPAHLEDVLASASIRPERDRSREQMRMLFGGLCVRCKVTQVDLEHGVHAKDGEPFKTFQSARPRRLDLNDGKPDKRPTFGVNVVAEKNAWGRIISIGDPIVALEEKE